MATYHFETKPHGNMKSGRKVNAALHYDYISREGKYDEKEDLVFKTSGNIPWWAKDARDFWKEAEKQRYKGNQYIDKNGNLRRTPEGRAYRDFIMSLPEEEGFTSKDYKEMVENFLGQYRISKEHVYSYAIHDKKASLDPSHRNVHVHIMFDERIIEKDRYVPRYKYFKVYRKNGNGEAIGGYKKDKSYNSKEMLISMRKSWEQILNDKYAVKGYDIRVTSDSLQTQRNNLLLQEKYDEALGLNYKPTPHLGRSYYRNPNALNLLHRLEDNLEKALEENKEFKIPAGDTDPDILKLYDYAFAIATKKMAKELQQLRLDAKKKKMDEERQQLAHQLELEKEDRYEQMQKEIEEDFHETDPLYITTGDLVDFCAAKATLEKQKAEDAKEAYVSIRKQLRVMEKYTDKDYDRMAEDKLFGGDSTKAKKEYQNVINKLQRRVGLPYSDIQQLNSDKAYWGKKVSYFKHQKAKQIDVFNGIKKNLMNGKTTLQNQGKEYYKTFKTYEKLAAEHDNLADLLTDKFSYNEILFTEKVPGTLGKRCKINGQVPLEKLPKTKLGKYTFYLFTEDGQVPADFELNYGNLKAVVEGADIIKGTVRTYDVTMNERKIIDIQEAKPTPLYRKRQQQTRAEQKQDLSEKRFSKFLLTRSLMKFNLKNVMVSRKLNGIINKLLEDNQKVFNADPYFAQQREKEKLKNVKNELEYVEAAQHDVFER